MWASDINPLREIIPKKYLEWLEKPYHLSAALQRVCHELRVQVLYEGNGVLEESERDFLQTPPSEKNGYVRNVFLLGDDLPFCFAHIVVPSHTYRQYYSEFCQLGERLLGNTLFYSNPQTTRSPFQYGLVQTQILGNSFLFNKLNANTLSEGAVPARRSVFYMDGQFPVLVIEAFFPDIPSYQE